MLHEHRYRRRRACAARSLVAVVLSAAMAVLAGCAPAPTRDDPWPPVELGVETYTLDNGLEVILRQDERVPIASVNLWYHVGPANEGPGRTGFAHLFEHMMFQGSGHVAPDAHFAHLQAVGASDANGYTTSDYTKYLEDVPANALETALWLESDRMGFLLDTLDQAQLSNQQSVVRNERRQSTEAAPYGLSQEVLDQLLFPEGHPYRPGVIGSHEDIQAAQLDDVRAFFARYYVPNNATLAIVGNIDIPATKALIEKYFGSIPRGAKVPVPQVAMPVLAQEQRRTVTDEVELPMVTMAWLTPPAFASGDAEADVTAGILGGGKTSRLYRELVHRTGIAQDVSAHQSSRQHGSVFTIAATAKPGHTADELEAAIQAELDALARSGPTGTEVTAAATTLRSDLIFELEHPGALADRLNYYNHFVGDPGYLEQDLRRYAEVDAADVTRFVVEQLSRDRRAVVHTVPGEKVWPADPPAPPAPAATETAPRGPSAEPWRNTAPAPGPAATASLPGAQRFELANGLPVYLVESHGLPITVASLVSRWGSAADPAGQSGLAEFSAAMLDEGTSTRDALGIAREIERLGAGLSTWAGGDGSGIQVTALTPRLDAAMAVMSDVVKTPEFPPAEIERVRNELLVGQLQAGDDPMAIASTVMSREVYGPQHPYGQVGGDVEAALTAIGREDLLRHHRVAFTPGNTALIMAGDLTVEGARALAEKHFGGWRGDGADPAPPGPPAPSAERVFVVDQPGSSQTALLLAQPGVGMADPDLPKLTVLNAVLGGGFSSRVNLNLRERNGYTYGASSAVSAGRGGGVITLQTSAQAEFGGASVRELLGEVAALQDAPVTAEELALAKESLSHSLPARFVTAGGAATATAELYWYDLPPDYFQRLPAVLAEIDAADVQEVARAHLRPHEIKVVAVGDRALIEAQLAELGLGPVAARGPDGGPATTP